MPLAQIRTRAKPNPQIKFEILVKKNLLFVFLELKQTMQLGIAKAGTFTRFFGNTGIPDSKSGIKGMSVLGLKIWSSKLGFNLFT